MQFFTGSIEKTQTDTRIKILTAVFFALLTAVCAKISIYLWFTPVPITFQVLAVILTGMLLGSRLGAISQIIYLSLGVMGLPVFAGIASGPAYIMGPTGGYLIGFIFAAFAAGWITENRKIHKNIIYPLAGIVSVAIIYLFGTFQLAAWIGISNGKNWVSSINEAWMMGTLPFIMIDIIKTLIASIIISDNINNNPILKSIRKF